MSHNAMPDEKGHKGFLFSGIATLFLIAFLDNSRGPIIPLLCRKLDIPYETAGTFLTLGCLAAVLSSLLLAKLLKNHSDRNVAIFSAAFALLPGMVAPFVSNKAIFILLGILMGASVTLMGTMCNVLTIKGSPSHLRGRYLSFQQVMYGIGSLLAPLTFAQLLKADFDWSWMLVGCSIANFSLGIIYYFILPNEVPEKVVKTPGKVKVSGKAIMMVALFSIYVGGEVLASMWMNVLMVDKYGLSAEDAAFYSMWFFAVIGIARFVCFLIVRPAWESKVLYGSLALGVIFGILGQQGHSWALSMMGIVGPFFPLCMARLSRDFPNDWKVMTVYVYIGIQTTLAVVHQSVGSIADALGIENAFLLSPFFLFLTLVLLFISMKAKKPLAEEGLNGKNKARGSSPL